MPAAEHPPTERNPVPAEAREARGIAAAARRPSPAHGPRLPSRRAAAALAGVVFVVSVGLGAALPGGRSGSVALGADSPLTASLLGAIAADQEALDRAATPQARQVSGQETPQASQQETANETGSGTKAQTSAHQETGPSGPETEGTGPEGVGSPEAGESAGSPFGAGKSPGSSKSKAGAHVSPALLAQITHVWVISLAGASFTAALHDPAADPYLVRQLLSKGALLTHYALVGSSSAANEIALLSGQAPNAETQRDCPTYLAVAPASVDSKGLANGNGCVYPAAAKTLADQVSEAALTWRAYVQDMAPSAGGANAGQSAASGQDSASGSGTQAGPSTAAGQAAMPEATCRHPQPGGFESTTPPTAGDDYLVSRNPFVYFDSLLESQACIQDDVDLSRLSSDLARRAETPNLSWIVPSACDDGSQTSCGAGSSTGLPAADAFLDKVVPQILATAAYREHGMVIVTFDESSSAQSGAQVGALVLSPFVRAGVRVAEPLTTYSLLKSLERLFGVPLLGHAADQSVTELDAEVYRAANTALVRAAPRQGPSQIGG